MVDVNEDTPGPSLQCIATQVAHFLQLDLLGFASNAASALEMIPRNLFTDGTFGNLSHDQLMLLEDVGVQYIQYCNLVYSSMIDSSWTFLDWVLASPMQRLESCSFIIHENEDYEQVIRNIIRPAFLCEREMSATNVRKFLFECLSTARLADKDTWSDFLFSQLSNDGKVTIQEDIVPNDAMERFLAHRIAASIKPGDVIALKKLSMVASASKPTLPSETRCIRDVTALIQFVVTACMQFSVLSDTVGVQIMWDLIETTPASAPAGASDECLALLEQLDAIQSALVASEMLIRHLPSGMVPELADLVPEDMKGEVVPGVGQGSGARLKRRKGIKALLTGCGTVLADLRALEGLLSTQQSDTGSIEATELYDAKKMSSSSSGFAETSADIKLSQALVLQICQQFGFKLNEKRKAAIKLGVLSSPKTPGKSKSTNDAAATPEILWERDQWAELCRDIKALYVEYIAGSDSELESSWVGQVVLAKILTYGTSGATLEVVDKIKEYEEAKRSLIIASSDSNESGGTIEPDIEDMDKFAGYLLGSLGVTVEIMAALVLHKAREMVNATSSCDDTSLDDACHLLKSLRVAPEPSSSSSSSSKNALAPTISKELHILTLTKLLSVLNIDMIPLRLRMAQPITALEQIIQMSTRAYARADECLTLLIEEGYTFENFGDDTESKYSDERANVMSIFVQEHLGDTASKISGVMLCTLLCNALGPGPCEAGSGIEMLTELLCYCIDCALNSSDIANAYKICRYLMTEKRSLSHTSTEMQKRLLQAISNVYNALHMDEKVVTDLTTKSPTKTSKSTPANKEPSVHIQIAVWKAMQADLSATMVAVAPTDLIMSHDALWKPACRSGLPSVGMHDESQLFFGHMKDSREWQVVSMRRNSYDMSTSEAEQDHKAVEDVDSIYDDFLLIESAREALLSVIGSILQPPSSALHISLPLGSCEDIMSSATSVSATRGMHALGYLTSLSESKLAFELIDNLTEDLQKKASVLKQRLKAQRGGMGTSQGIVINEEIVTRLMGKGFTRNGARRAVLATKAASFEKALVWAIEHTADPGFDHPVTHAAPGALLSDNFEVRGFEGGEAAQRSGIMQSAGLHSADIQKALEFLADVRNVFVGLVDPWDHSAVAAHSMRSTQQQNQTSIPAESMIPFKVESEPDNRDVSKPTAEPATTPEKQPADVLSSKKVSPDVHAKIRSSPKKVVKKTPQKSISVHPHEHLECDVSSDGIGSSDAAMSGWADLDVSLDLDSDDDDDDDDGRGAGEISEKGVGGNEYQTADMTPRPANQETNTSEVESVGTTASAVPMEPTEPTEPTKPREPSVEDSKLTGRDADSGKTLSPPAAPQVDVLGLGLGLPTAPVMVSASASTSIMETVTRSLNPSQRVAKLKSVLEVADDYVGMGIDTDTFGDAILLPAGASNRTNEVVLELCCALALHSGVSYDFLPQLLPLLPLSILQYMESKVTAYLVPNDSNMRNYEDMQSASCADNVNWLLSEMRFRIALRIDLSSESQDATTSRQEFTAATRFPENVVTRLSELDVDTGTTISMSDCSTVFMLQSPMHLCDVLCRLYNAASNSSLRPLELLKRLAADALTHYCECKDVTLGRVAFECIQNRYTASGSTGVGDDWAQVLQLLSKNLLEDVAILKRMSRADNAEGLNGKVFMKSDELLYYPVASNTLSADRRDVAIQELSPRLNPGNVAAWNRTVGRVLGVGPSELYYYYACSRIHEALVLDLNSLDNSAVQNAGNTASRMDRYVGPTGLHMELIEAFKHMRYPHAKALCKVIAGLPFEPADHAGLRPPQASRYMRTHPANAANITVTDYEGTESATDFDSLASFIPREAVDEILKNVVSFFSRQLDAGKASAEPRSTAKTCSVSEFQELVSSTEAFRLIHGVATMLPRPESSRVLSCWAVNDVKGLEGIVRACFMNPTMDGVAVRNVYEGLYASTTCWSVSSTTPTTDGSSDAAHFGAVEDIAQSCLPSLCGNLSSTSVPTAEGVQRCIDWIDKTAVLDAETATRLHTQLTESLHETSWQVTLSILREVKKSMAHGPQKPPQRFAGIIGVLLKIRIRDGINVLDDRFVREIQVCHHLLALYDEMSDDGDFTDAMRSAVAKLRPMESPSSQFPAVEAGSVIEQLMNDLAELLLRQALSIDISKTSHELGTMRSIVTHILSLGRLYGQSYFGSAAAFFSAVAAHSSGNRQETVTRAKLPLLVVFAKLILLCSLYGMHDEMLEILLVDMGLNDQSDSDMPIQTDAETQPPLMRTVPDALVELRAVSGHDRQTVMNVLRGVAHIFTEPLRVVYLYALGGGSAVRAREMLGTKQACMQAATENTNSETLGDYVSPQCRRCLYLLILVDTRSNIFTKMMRAPRSDPLFSVYVQMIEYIIRHGGCEDTRGSPVKNDHTCGGESNKGAYLKQAQRFLCPLSLCAFLSREYAGFVRDADASNTRTPYVLSTDFLILRMVSVAAVSEASMVAWKEAFRGVEAYSADEAMLVLLTRIESLPRYCSWQVSTASAERSDAEEIIDTLGWTSRAAMAARAQAVYTAVIGAQGAL